MLPLQEIRIFTREDRVMFVHLEKWGEEHYECKLAYIKLGRTENGDATFGEFNKATSAREAYQNLIDSLKKSLKNLAVNDAISMVDNPCNTEFINATEQKECLGDAVVLKVNNNIIV